MDLFLHMVYITSLIPPPFIEMPVPSQESDPSCICISGVGFTKISILSCALQFKTRQSFDSIFQ
jgi:hypothetical protein